MSGKGINWWRDKVRHRNAAAVDLERTRLGHMLGRAPPEKEIPPRPVDPAITMPMVSILREDWDGETKKLSSGN